MQTGDTINQSQYLETRQPSFLIKGLRRERNKWKYVAKWRKKGFQIVKGSSVSSPSML